jgi:high affinity Mn2+ porin
MPLAPIDGYPGNRARTWPALVCVVVMIHMSSSALADDLVARAVVSPTPKPTVVTPSTEKTEPDPNRFRWVPPDIGEDRFVARAQVTYTWQRQFGFNALYSGPQSLATHPETSYTLSSTAYLGARLWDGGELYADPEAFQATPLSGLHGLAGINNGELQKASGEEIRAYAARLFLRETFGLGGESYDVEPGFNQVKATYERRRLVFSLGKFPLTDFFERSNYANDPRTQFLNWSLITYGAYDYAADARGYNIGGVMEFYWDDWAFRIGRGMEPIVANGRSLHYDLFTRHGDQVELEHDHKIGNLELMSEKARGRPGRRRLFPIN